MEVCTGGTGGANLREMDGAGENGRGRKRGWESGHRLRGRKEAGMHSDGEDLMWTFEGTATE